VSFRVALFCSHYSGLAMLEKLLLLQQKIPEIEIVGVATDDPTKAWVSPEKRLWRLPHTREEEEMVADLATQQGIPVWRGRVRTEEFQTRFIKEWMPDVSYMSAFGQRIPESIWSSPLYGFYNFHPCAGKTWPSNVGTNPLESMASDEEARGAIAMHAVDNEFDHGDLVAFSEFFSFSPQEGVMETFKRISPLAAELMAWHVGEILGDTTLSSTPRIVIDEQMAFVRTRQAKLNKRAS